MSRPAVHAISSVATTAATMDSSATRATPPACSVAGTTSSAVLRQEADRSTEIAVTAASAATTPPPDRASARPVARSDRCVVRPTPNANPDCSAPVDSPAWTTRTAATMSSNAAAATPATIRISSATASSSVSTEAAVDAPTWEKTTAAPAADAMPLSFATTKTACWSRLRQSRDLRGCVAPRRSPGACNGGRRRSRIRSSAGCLHGDQGCSRGPAGWPGGPTRIGRK